MNNSNFYVIAFDSTHHAIKGEKILKSEGFNIKTIPTPREITASCGLSIKLDVENIDDVKKTIESNELGIKGLFEISINENGRTAKKIF